MFKRLRKQFGEHYAESYANKLLDTYLILARKVNEPKEVSADSFWWETIVPIVGDPTNGVASDSQSANDPRDVSSLVIPKKTGKGWRVASQPDDFKPARKVTVGKSGLVKSVEDISHKQ